MTLESPKALAIQLKIPTLFPLIGTSQSRTDFTTLLLRSPFLATCDTVYGSVQGSTFCAPRRPSMSAKAGKSERPLCKTCSNISLQELATDRGVILPHRWDHLRENPESCPLCEAVSGAIRIGNPAKPRLVIRAIPGGASPAGSPLRFLVLGLPKGCP
jgi:hypothetical protein